MEYSSSIYHREDSVLHSRYIYTHSDCSSSLSSLSMHSHYSGSIYTSFGQQLSQWPSGSQVTKILTQLSILLVIALSAGLCLIHGNFEIEYEILFGAYANGPKTVSLVGALQIAFFLATATCVDMSRWVGVSVSVVVGSLISGGGLLAAGFADRIWQLCLSQGVAVGIGAGISTRAAVVAAERRRMSDDGGGSTRRLVVMDAGIGGCILALVVSRLITVGTTSSALKWLSLVIFSGQLVAAILLYFLPTISEQIPVSNDIGPVKTSRQAFAQHKLVRVLRLVSQGIHSLTAILPLVFIPNYSEEETRLNSAILVATLCVGVASGAALSGLLGRWSFKESLLRLGLSLCVWCLWLPLRFGDSRALLCVFCGVYGLFLGLVTCLSSSGVLAAAMTMVGVPVAGWIATSDVSSFVVDPVAALAAACSLMATISAVAADAVASRG